MKKISGVLPEEIRRMLTVRGVAARLTSAGIRADEGEARRLLVRHQVEVKEEIQHSQTGVIEPLYEKSAIDQLAKFLTLLEGAAAVTL